MKIFATEEGENILKTKLGTEGYMAPEILGEDSYKGPPVDIFAAGVILFQMLTCNQPFLNGGDKWHVDFI
jgi:serine/threonine protein kinase